MNAQPLPSHLITLFGNYHLGIARGEEFVVWAVDRLVEGEDTLTLCVLAGEPSSILMTDAEALFRTVLEEMHLPFLADKKFVFLLRVRQISEDLLADRISAIDACETIHSLTYSSNYDIKWEEWESLYSDLIQWTSPPAYQYLDHPDMNHENFAEYAKEAARKFLARSRSPHEE